MDTEAIRAENLASLTKLGFAVAPSLPTKRDSYVLRPTEEIARRLTALDAVFTWVSADEKDAPGEALRSYVERNDLERSMTRKETGIFRMERAAAHDAHVETIGWKLENVWGLAWVLGFEKEPGVDGKMIETETTRAILLGMLPKLTENLDVLLARATPRSLEEVVRLEDLFYCCHNAVRSAQLGGKTVPDGFHPISNGGVIHERRHSLSWCLSPGSNWDDTDLST